MHATVNVYEQICIPVARLLPDLTCTALGPKWTEGHTR